MMEIIANAKINLFLEITGKLQNGYHTVDTIMQSVSLSDTVSLDLLPASDGIIITCDDPNVPTDDRNIAYKTAKAYFNEINADCGARIIINKSIPSEAGMGGGSADGAAVLVGLNLLCGSGMSTEGLCKIASRIGADIPFCIMGGTKRLQGIGTDLYESYKTPLLDLLIVKPQVGISTPDAYRYLDKLHSDFDTHSPVIPDKKLYNRFEEVLPHMSPMCVEILSYLRDNSHGALLCGSGTAMFAITDGLTHAHKLTRFIENKFPGCFTAAVRTESTGCIINS